MLRRLHWLVLLLAGFVVETFDTLEECPYCGGCNETCVLQATFARGCPSNSWTNGTGAAGIDDCLCFAGFKRNGTECLACVGDEFCPWGDRNSPVACPVGYRCTNAAAFPLPGVWHGGVFELCPGGYLCAVNWTIVPPKPCGDGFFCPPGSDTPTPCPAATACMHNASQPVVCPAGFVCPVGVALVCPQRFYCPAASSVGIVCPPGFACGNGTAEPVACRAGTLCPEGTAAPVPCPGGSICVDPLLDPVECSAGDVCPPGSSAPTPCPAGWICGRGCAVAAVCPANFYCPRNVSTPLPCPVDYLCPAGSSMPLRGTTAPPTTPAPLVCNSSFVLDVLGKRCIPAQTTSYASVLEVSMPVNLTVVTKENLVYLVKEVANQSGCVRDCDAVVLSITDPNGVTVYCTNGVCPGFNDGRRRLLVLGRYFIVFGIVSKEPIASNISYTLTLGSEPLPYTYRENVQVDNGVLADVSKLLAAIKGPAATSNDNGGVSAGMVAGIVVGCLLGMALAGLGVLRLRAIRKGRMGAECIIAEDCISVRITPDEIEQEGHMKVI